MFHEFYHSGTVNDKLYSLLESGECTSLETEALAVTYVPFSVPEPEKSEPAGDFHQIPIFLVNHQIPYCKAVKII